MRGFILLATLVVCVGCSGAKPTVEEPVPVSKLASLQPYKRPEQPQPTPIDAKPKKIESKKIIEKKQEKPIDQMKEKESKEVAKKTLSAKEKINEERYERERIRLAGLENEFALLDLASKVWIIRVRRKLPSGDFKDFDDSDFAALRMFTKFFNSAHLLRLCFLCAEDQGLADKAIGYLKLTDDDDIEKFKVLPNRASCS